MEPNEPISIEELQRCFEQDVVGKLRGVNYLKHRWGSLITSDAVTGELMLWGARLSILTELLKEKATGVVLGVLDCLRYINKFDKTASVKKLWTDYSQTLFDVIMAHLLCQNSASKSFKVSRYLMKELIVNISATYVVDKLKSKFDSLLQSVYITASKGNSEVAPYKKCDRNHLQKIQSITQTMITCIECLNIDWYDNDSRKLRLKGFFNPHLLPYLEGLSDSRAKAALTQLLKTIVRYHPNISETTTTFWLNLFNKKMLNASQEAQITKMISLMISSPGADVVDPPTAIKLEAKFQRQKDEEVVKIDIDQEDSLIKNASHTVQPTDVDREVILKRVFADKEPLEKGVKDTGGVMEGGVNSVGGGGGEGAVGGGGMGGRATAPAPFPSVNYHPHATRTAKTERSSEPTRCSDLLLDMMAKGGEEDEMDRSQFNSLMDGADGYPTSEMRTSSVMEEPLGIPNMSSFGDMLKIKLEESGNASFQEDQIYICQDLIGHDEKKRSSMYDLLEEYWVGLDVITTENIVKPEWNLEDNYVSIFQALLRKGYPNSVVRVLNTVIMAFGKMSDVLIAEIWDQCRSIFTNSMITFRKAENQVSTLISKLPANEQKALRKYFIDAIVKRIPSNCTKIVCRGQAAMEVRYIWYLLYNTAKDTVIATSESRRLLEVMPLWFTWQDEKGLKRVGDTLACLARKLGVDQVREVFVDKNAKMAAEVYLGNVTNEQTKDQTPIPSPVDDILLESEELDIVEWLKVQPVSSVAITKDCVSSGRGSNWIERQESLEKLSTALQRAQRLMPEPQSAKKYIYNGKTISVNTVGEEVPGTYGGWLTHLTYIVREDSNQVVKLSAIKVIIQIIKCLRFQMPAYAAKIVVQNISPKLKERNKTLSRMLIQLLVSLHTHVTPIENIWELELRNVVGTHPNVKENGFVVIAEAAQAPRPYNNLSVNLEAVGYWLLKVSVWGMRDKTKSVRTSAARILEMSEIYSPQVNIERALRCSAAHGGSDEGECAPRFVNLKQEMFTWGSMQPKSRKILATYLNEKLAKGSRSATTPVPTTAITTPIIPNTTAVKLPIDVGLQSNLPAATKNTLNISDMGKIRSPRRPITRISSIFGFDGLYQEAAELHYRSEAKLAPVVTEATVQCLYRGQYSNLGKSDAIAATIQYLASVLSPTYDQKPIQYTVGNGQRELVDKLFVSWDSNRESYRPVPGLQTNDIFTQFFLSENGICNAAANGLLEYALSKMVCEDTTISESCSLLLAAMAVNLHSLPPIWEDNHSGEGGWVSRLGSVTDHTSRLGIPIMLEKFVTQPSDFFINLSLIWTSLTLGPPRDSKLYDTSDIPNKAGYSLCRHIITLLSGKQLAETHKYQLLKIWAVLADYIGNRMHSSEQLLDDLLVIMHFTHKDESEGVRGMAVEGIFSFASYFDHPSQMELFRLLDNGVNFTSDIELLCHEYLRKNISKYETTTDGTERSRPMSRDPQQFFIGTSVEVNDEYELSQMMIQMKWDILSSSTNSCEGRMLPLDEEFRCYGLTQLALAFQKNGNREWNDVIRLLNINRHSLTVSEQQYVLDASRLNRHLICDSSLSVEYFSTISAVAPYLIETMCWGIVRSLAMDFCESDRVDILNNYSSSIEKLLKHKFIINICSMSLCQLIISSLLYTMSSYSKQLWGIIATPQVDKVVQSLNCIVGEIMLKHGASHGRLTLHFMPMLWFLLIFNMRGSPPKDGPAIWRENSLYTSYSKFSFVKMRDVRIESALVFKMLRRLLFTISNYNIRHIKTHGSIDKKGLIYIFRLLESVTTVFEIFLAMIPLDVAMVANIVNRPISNVTMAKVNESLNLIRRVDMGNLRDINPGLRQLQESVVPCTNGFLLYKNTFEIPDHEIRDLRHSFREAMWTITVLVPGSIYSYFNHHGYIGQECIPLHKKYVIGQWEKLMNEFAIGPEAEWSYNTAHEFLKSWDKEKLQPPPHIPVDTNVLSAELEGFLSSIYPWWDPMNKTMDVDLNDLDVCIANRWENYRKEFGTQSATEQHGIYELVDVLNTCKDVTNPIIAKYRDMPQASVSSEKLNEIDKLMKSIEDVSKCQFTNISLSHFASMLEALNDIKFE